MNFIDLRYYLYVPVLSQLIETFRVLGLRMLGSKIGKNSFVRSGLFITYPHYLTIGKNTKIGVKSKLFLYDNFVVGDNVEIGSGLVVHTSEHIYNDPGKPIAKQGAEYKKVIIGDNVYIGSEVVILAGTVIEDNIIVAAGSVVTKTLESGKVYGGVPAKIIKNNIYD